MTDPNGRLLRENEREQNSTELMQIVIVATLVTKGGRAVDRARFTCGFEFDPTRNGPEIARWGRI